MISPARLAMPALCLALLSAPQPAAAQPAPAAKAPDLVMAVGPTDVTRAELIRFLLERTGRGALEALTNQLLVSQEAARAEVRVSEADVAARRAEVERSLGGPLSYQRFLDESNLTDDLYREQIRYNLLAERLAAHRHPPTPEELERVVVRTIAARDATDAAAILAYFERSRGQDFDQAVQARAAQFPNLRSPISERPFLRMDNPQIYDAVAKLQAGQYLTEAVQVGRMPLIVKLVARLDAPSLQPEERAAAVRRLSAARAPEVMAALREEARLQDPIPFGDLIDNDPPVGNDGIVRRVNSAPITRAALLERALSYSGEPAREALANLIVLENEAKRLEVTLPEAQIDAELQKRINAVGGEESLNAALKEAGATRAGLREQVRVAMLTAAVAKKKWPIRDTDLYRLQFRYIRVDDERLARQIIADIRRGVSFDLLARRNSLDPEAKINGGLVGDGPVFRIDSPALFNEVLKQRLRPGEYTRTPVRVKEFALIFRLEQALAPSSLTAAERDRITRRIEEFRSAHLIESLRARVEVHHFRTVSGLIEDLKDATDS